MEDVEKAHHLYQSGLKNNDTKLLMEALDQMIQAKTPCYRLWGNILVQLASLMHDSSFVEQALDKYARSDDLSPGFYWEWAEAWVLLALYSSEVSDVKQGLMKFACARELGCDAPMFTIDNALALMVCGSLEGNPAPLDEARDLLAPLVTDREVAVSAWKAYVSVLMRRFTLTHRLDHFKEADHAFHEAILSVPEQSDLWLKWGELYLHAGCARHDVGALEVAIEKLTSLKAVEGDPLVLSALLGKGLALLGVHHEDLKLLKQGQERVERGLELAPKHRELGVGSAWVNFARGFYFADARSYARAAAIFEEEIEKDATAYESWHGLYHTYVCWGVMTGDTTLAYKGMEAIARLSALRPFSAVHLNEWGIALLQLKQLEGTYEGQQAAVEEAIVRFKAAYALEEEMETLYNLGCAYDQLGDVTGDEEAYEEAIDLLSQVHENNSFDFHICYHLALAHGHLGELMGEGHHLQRAAELFAKLTDVDEEDGALFGDLGYTLLNLSELVYDGADEYRRQAEVHLLRAAELGYVEANYHLACLYALAQLPDPALQFLRRAHETRVLPPPEDVWEDEWLANIRHLGAFKELMTK